MDAVGSICHSEFARLTKDINDIMSTMPLDGFTTEHKIKCLDDVENKLKDLMDAAQTLRNIYQARKLRTPAVADAIGSDKEASQWP